MTEPLTTAEAMEAAALNREPHTDGTDHAPAPPHGPRPRSPAEWACRRIVLYLKAFEENLDEEHEAAMGFASGPGDGVMRIQGIGFSAPDLVTFAGVDARGERMQLVQHLSQLSVAFRAVRKAPDRPAQRIGFKLSRALEDDPATGAKRHADTT
ncbi:DUF6173 family protein [Jannaschia aquimarina]|uniref:Uncharacterized protein n=1 Tax=Jannaschia aquimarina TaxID=935700 RepID=A0A0D1EN03_9RHOB|nr:DUF6173 family protein [Jannaschia aquimarina]KIT17085.1 hypothetical protein jaqu_11270 [Jannaschia aquimarina]SNS46451.1 hypothetical protein SAMN05421775_10148 [Jannaschia aquimarina]